MNRTRIDRILKQLENYLDNDQELLQQQANENRRKRDIETYEALRAAIPPKLRTRVDAIFSDPDFYSKYRGWFLLEVQFFHGWRPKQIPTEVVLAYLEYPFLEPWLKCTPCDMFLPTGSGYWTQVDRPSFWQGSFVPFVNCPTCGTLAVNKDGSAHTHSRHLPPIADPTPFRFHLERPTDGKLTEVFAGPSVEFWETNQNNRPRKVLATAK